MAAVDPAASADAPVESSVPSPCVSICNMDPATGLCSGCLRTIDEIAGWGRMTAAEQWGVMARREQARCELATGRPARRGS